MRLTLTFCLVLGLFSMAQAATVADYSDIIHALEHVESDDNVNVPDGDGGAAHGILQIHYAYWYDATHNAAGKKIFPGSYDDCSKRDYAEQIVLRYWERYAPQALEDRNYEVLARIHNGGWNGAKKSATLKYWKRVKNFLGE